MNILAGIGAALLMPLFLSMLSSSLLPDMLAADPKLDDFLVFGGFCLLAAISARTFIQTLSDKILREVKETKKEQVLLGEQVKSVKSNVESAIISAQAAQDAVQYYTALKTEELGTSPNASDFPKFSREKNLMTHGRVNLGSQRR